MCVCVLIVQTFMSIHMFICVYATEQEGPGDMYESPQLNSRGLAFCYYCEAS